MSNRPAVLVPIESSRDLRRTIENAVAVATLRTVLRKTTVPALVLSVRDGAQPWPAE